MSSYSESARATRSGGATPRVKTCRLSPPCASSITALLKSPSCSAEMITRSTKT